MWDGDKKKALLLEYQTAFVLTQSLTIRRDKQNLQFPASETSSTFATNKLRKKAGGQTVLKFKYGQRHKPLKSIHISSL